MQRERKGEKNISQDEGSMIFFRNISKEQALFLDCTIHISSVNANIRPRYKNVPQVNLQICMQAALFYLTRHATSPHKQEYTINWEIFGVQIFSNDLLASEN